MNKKLTHEEVIQNKKKPKKDRAFKGSLFNEWLETINRNIKNAR